ncbi:hypothetical protein CMI37_35925 [Candidatus Pacearchaeota archaeon]|jgi:adenylate kinase family enzyme|nr:hypothetical protein [Candidatus Pacearchaeota archaeon]|tara:strand:- start:3294 stop:4133 length:840 start_codon:yes stop_codon:yes gene_type:complete
MKIAFGMIVFEGDYVLQQCIEQVYPHASQIVIAEGPVKFWQSKGRNTSTDRTNEIIDNFPDPENKIKVVHGQFSEKDQQCNAYMNLINEDTDYLWMIDSDEVYKTADILKTIDFLKEYKPTSVGVQSCSFYGGFDHYLTGFEQNVDNFLRIFKYEPGCDWLTHRPPTMKYKQTVQRSHINSQQFYELTGVMMYHYSYVFDKQVKNKVEYYKAKVSQHKCIDQYYERVFVPWVNGDFTQRLLIENEYKGVHEWKPEYRGPCRTERFIGCHPKAIEEAFEV